MPGGVIHLHPGRDAPRLQVGAAPSRKLNFSFPAAMVGYFDDLSDAIGNDDVDDRLLADIARRHSMEVVGPVPDSYV